MRSLVLGLTETHDAVRPMHAGLPPMPEAGLEALGKKLGELQHTGTCQPMDTCRAHWRKLLAHKAIRGSNLASRKLEFVRLDTFDRYCMSPDTLLVQCSGMKQKRFVKN